MRVPDCKTEVNRRFPIAIAFPKVAALGKRDPSVDDGLEAFAAHGGGAVAETEIARRGAEGPLPRGWQPLWRAGETGMFFDSTTDDGHEAITCRCCNDAAIIKYPLDIELDESPCSSSLEADSGRGS